MLIATTALEVSDEVRRRRTDAPQIVGVDGFTGSGKSTLSTALVGSLGARLLSCDEYVDRSVKEESYCAMLRRADLIYDFRQALESHSTVILDAVCLREVVRYLEVNPHSFVYVKRVSQAGVWNDGLDLDDFKEATEGSFRGKWIEREVFRYHLDHHPLERADILFERVEDPCSAA